MTISKKEQTANQLINKIKDFPPLPGFIAKIMQLNTDPDSTFADIGKVVETEVSLASSIIKLANSPFFGVSHSISSIPHAISLLGRKELLNLVLAQAMFQTYKGFKGKKAYIGVLRFHCFKCALVASYLGGQIGQKGGELFLAGLVHDIGKIIIYLAFSEESLEKVYHCVPVEHDDTSDEQQKLGIDHTFLGHSLLASWMFPEPLLNAVKFHHHPQEAGEDNIYPLIIYTADMLVRIIDGQENGDDYLQKLTQRLFARPIAPLLTEIGLEITAENLDPLLAEIQEHIAQEGERAEMFG